MLPKPVILIALVLIITASSCREEATENNTEHQLPSTAEVNADSLEAANTIIKFYNWAMHNAENNKHILADINLNPVPKKKVLDTMKHVNQYSFQGFDPETDTSANWYFVTIDFKPYIDSLRQLNVFTPEFLIAERNRFNSCDSFIHKTFFNTTLDEGWDWVNGESICYDYADDRLFGVMELPQGITLSNFRYTDTTIHVSSYTNYASEIQLKKSGGHWRIHSLERKN